MRSQTRSGHSKRGQAVVEFAIVLPVLLILLIGLVNLGFLINAQIILTQAAWEGARTGATLDPANGEGDAEINGAVQSALAGLPDPSAVAISIDPDESARGAMSWPKPRGESLNVDLSYPLNLAIPVPITLNLGAQATSRIEYSNLP
ncbi:MAG: TadE/TadG family type IV pilus assembly protein [Anaerolineales bacterium]|jgi:Flp pilus assembly protein TadG